MSCFFETCEKQFRFLEQEFGFIYISGIAEYKQGRQIIRPVPSQTQHPISVDSDFSLVTRYEKDERAIEFSYVLPDGNLTCMFHSDRVNRLRLHDLLLTLKKEIDLSALEKPAKQADLIVNALQCASKAIHDNPVLLDTADNKLYDRALTMRQKMLEHRLREQLKKEMDLSVNLAAKAFLQQDFARVIVLLRPYEAFLSSGDLKKLNHARKKMQP